MDKGGPQASPRTLIRGRLGMVRYSSPATDITKCGHGRPTKRCHAAVRIGLEPQGLPQQLHAPHRRAGCRLGSRLQCIVVLAHPRGCARMRRIARLPMSAQFLLRELGMHLRVSVRLLLTGWVVCSATPLVAEQDGLCKSMERASVEAGQRVALRCKACHTLEEGGANKLGPNLWRDSRSAQRKVEGFKYSECSRRN